MQVVIPCKAFGLGKSRLSSCLEPVSREKLCKDLFSRTLELAMSAFSKRQICVVTNDKNAIALARSFSINIVIDPNKGLNESLETARRESGATSGSMLVLPIDLPYADKQILTSFCESEEDVVIAPDEVRTGTNLLRIRARALREFAFEFGEGSYVRHLAQVRAKGLSVQTVVDWRLGFDLDGPAQYSNWKRCEEHAAIV